MTRKDYIRIARALNTAWKTSEDKHGLNTAIDSLVEELRDDNPNFDAVRFIAACKEA